MRLYSGRVLSETASEFLSLVLPSIHETVCGWIDKYSYSIIFYKGRLTITDDSHIFRVVAVVLEYLVMGAAQEVVLSASTHHIVQSDGTRTSTKCTVNATNRRA